MSAVTPLARAAATACAALLLSGCTFTNPQTTQASYAPGDGEDIKALGAGIVVSALMVVAADEGEPGRLVARVANDSPEDLRISFTGEGVDEVVSAPAQDTLVVGEPEDEEAVEIIIDAVPVAPGLLLPMTLAVEGGNSVDVQVPVLDGTLSEYEAYLPSPEAPEPEGGATGTEDEQGGGEAGAGGAAGPEDEPNGGSAPTGPVPTPTD